MDRVDLGRLREARGFAGVNTAEREYLAKVADAVLAAPTVWWCVAHRARASEFGECHHATIQRMAMETPGPCEKERSVVVPVVGGQE